MRGLETHAGGKTGEDMWLPVPFSFQGECLSAPFGVELPETFDAPAESASPARDTAPESASPAAPESSGAATETKSTEPGVTDLDSLERFRFRGKEISRDDLEKLLAGEGNEGAESDNAKFDANFRYDLAAVLSDPSKLAAFRQIYPPEYTRLVEQALKAQGVTPSAPQKPDASKPPADPRLDEVYQIAQEWKAHQKEQRVQGLNTMLDKAFDKFAKKYPDADHEVINSRLWGLNSQGQNLLNDKGQLKEDLVEKLFKADHEARNKAYEEKYRRKVEEQKRASSRARDVGQGGSASSPAPTKARTLKEATAAAIAHFEGNA